MRRLLVLLFGLSAFALAFENASPFVVPVQGALSPYGFSGYIVSPARFSSPGFALSAYRTIGEVDQYVLGAFGDIGLGRYRIVFFSAFQGLDSLYRQSYSEIDASWTCDFLALGAGYGFSLEWIPGVGKWTRHRYKGGVLVLWRDFALGASAMGYTGDFPDIRGGVHWLPRGSFSAFAESDGEYVWFGNGVRFRYGEVHVSYRFPDFAVTVEVSFLVRGWFGGAYAGPGKIPVWGVYSGKTLAN